MEPVVSDHYGVADLGPRILDALAEAGVDVDALTIDDLAPVDAFHIRGRAATEELAGWVALGPEHRLLDVGCGIGGTSRYLASRFGCDVTGIDLTDEYCRAAEMLSARVGLTDRTVFRRASALALPFDDASFDVVWTEHVQMNIADKAGFYGELRRALKPGGQLAFHDIFAGAATDGFAFPVPWAPDPSISHLAPADEVAARLADLGLERVRWEDKTEESSAFFRKAITRRAPVGLHLIMKDSRTKLENVLRNLEAGRLQVVQAVMRAPAA